MENQINQRIHIRLFEQCEQCPISSRLKLLLCDSPVDCHELLSVISANLLTLFRCVRHRNSGDVILLETLCLVDSFEVRMSIAFGHVPVIEFFNIYRANAVMIKESRVR